MRILVADDDAGTRLIVKRICEKEEHEVLEAKDGVSAYETAVQNNPVVVVLDIHMPAMDGLEVLRRLQDNHATRRMPVIMLTNVPVQKGESVAMSFGASHYIAKPLDPDVLRLAIRAACRELDRPVEEVPVTPAEDYNDVDEIDNASNGNGSIDWEESLPLRREPDETYHTPEAIGVGNFMLDEKLGGGIPLGSLSFIEGDLSAGKSVFCKHLTYTTLVKGHSAAYFSFEDTTHSLIKQMASINLEVSEYYEDGKFRIYPLDESVICGDAERNLTILAKEIERLPSRFKTIVLDAITNLAAHSSETAMIKFISSCKRLCRNGRTIILVAHSATLDEKWLVRLAAVCDAHMRLIVAKMGPKLVKTIEVCKIHAAVLDTGNIVSFEVYPGIGMRLSPISKVTV